jgi:5-methylcytosine-specific restriction protein A
MCRVCLTPVGMSGHVDHIVPKAHGGTDDSGNLQTLCRSCHSSKTATEDGGGFGR